MSATYILCVFGDCFRCLILVDKINLISENFINRCKRKRIYYRSFVYEVHTKLNSLSFAIKFVRVQLYQIVVW